MPCGVPKKKKKKINRVLKSDFNGYASLPLMKVSKILRDLSPAK